MLIREPGFKLQSPLFKKLGPAVTLTCTCNDTGVEKGLNPLASLASWPSL